MSVCLLQFLTCYTAEKDFFPLLRLSFPIHFGKSITSYQHGYGFCSVGDFIVDQLLPLDTTFCFVHEQTAVHSPSLGLCATHDTYLSRRLDKRPSEVPPHMNYPVSKRNKAKALCKALKDCRDAGATSVLGTVGSVPNTAL